MNTTKIFTVSQMVAAERAADAAGVSYAAMMETAGRRVAEAISARVPVEGSRVLVMVGPGNNGGDGLVAGRYLAGMGADVAFYLYKARDPQRDVNFRHVQELEMFYAEADQDQRHRVLRTRLAASDILIDALLGTGVARPIEGRLADLLKQIAAGIAQATLSKGPPDLQSVASVAAAQREGEAAAPFVCAVDCPSGLNTDSGALDPLAIPADLTVTFAGPKRGHFILPGAAACGELVVADIGIPPELPEVAGVALSLVTAGWAQAMLPDRPSDGHKGTFGTAVIAAGSANYWGAPVLAGHGAYRAGAGLVALAVPRSVRATAAGAVPEATYPALAAADLLDEGSARELRLLLGRAQAFLFGPGLAEADDFVAALLDYFEQEEDLPAVIVDADGLNVLARHAGWIRRLPSWSILTPHPGEMSRLVGKELAQLREQDRVELAQTQARAWEQVVLLKGAYTVIAAPDGRAAQLPFANPLLAVAGSGDVLAGIIAGVAAQGLPPFEAAVLGAYLHGSAAELARATWGDSGLLAGELASWVPRVRLALLGAG